MSEVIKERIPAVEGWFALDGETPALIGLGCDECGTYVFPPRAIACPNPSCSATDLRRVPLARTGTVWSFTTNHYAPPEPYVAPDPFEPYTVAAVELDDQKLVVLGQVVDTEGLEVGSRVELVVDTLFEDDEGEHVVWKWKVTG